MILSIKVLFSQLILELEMKITTFKSCDKGVLEILSFMSFVVDD